MSWVLAAALATLDPFAQLAEAANNRDSAVLRALASPAVSERDLAFIKTDGAYGLGRFGWKAARLDGLDGRTYAVFSTVMTSQDQSEPLFEFDGGRLVRRIDEAAGQPWEIRDADFDVSIDFSQKAAKISARLDLAPHTGLLRPVWLRLGSNYAVKSMTLNGGEVPFRQAGGVLMAAPSGPGKLELEYAGTVDHPQFAGAIQADEAMLTNDIWWPSISRKPYRFRLTVDEPEGMRAFANGVRLPKPAPGRAAFDSRIPLNWLSLSVAPLPEDRAGGFWMASRSSDSADRKRQTELYGPVMSFYSRWAPSPYDGYGAVETPLYGSGALEAYSHATYGPGWLPDEDAHEPSHTWWGGLIGNSYLRSFWNESFAVWSEGTYARRGPVGQAGAKDAAFVQPAEPDESWDAAPLADSGAWLGPAASGLGYGKGAFVLQQLEFEAGSAKMDEWCREWLKRGSGRLGEWEDFEEVAGPEWKPFFDQWLRRPGAPQLEWRRLAWKNGHLTGEAHFTGEPYRLEVGAIIRLRAGGERRVKISLAPKGQAASFRVACPSAASVLFDPWRRLPVRRDAPEPDSWEGRWRQLAPVEDADRPDWRPPAGGRRRPAAQNGTLYCGRPEASPEAARIAKELGFQVDGSALIYRGRRYDLQSHAAFGVALGRDGKAAGIWIGKAELRPRTGNARCGVVDRLGRFLDGEAAPAQGGDWDISLSRT